MSKGQLTMAANLRPSDRLLTNGRLVLVTRVKRAQGRKPSIGENLHIVSEKDEVIKLNSHDPVRVVRP